MCGRLVVACGVVCCGGVCGGGVCCGAVCCGGVPVGTAEMFTPGLLAVFYFRGVDFFFGGEGKVDVFPKDSGFLKGLKLFPVS